MSPEERRAYNREWMRRYRRSQGIIPWAEHPKKVKPSRSRLTPEERRQRQRERYQRLRLELIEYQKRWANANPEKLRRNRTLGRRARDAWKRATRQGKVSYRRIIENSLPICGICHEFLDVLDLRAIHFDHIIPLSKGGAHTESNIRPTHPECNLRKASTLRT